MRLAFYAPQPSYRDHLEPVWERVGGEFYSEPGQIRSAPDGGAWVVASASSYSRVVLHRPRPVVYFEHGVGIVGTDGGGPRPLVELNCVPNQLVGNLYRGPVEIVGTPKLDRLLKIALPRLGVVAVTFHWDAMAQPNGRWAFSKYRGAIVELSRRFEVIGHGHPRVWGRLQRFYRDIGVTPVQRFEDVVKMADVLVADNTSAIYEWSALDRPAVRMQMPHHSELLERYPVGVPCSHPEALGDLVEMAREDPLWIRAMRHEATDALYPYLGSATDRAGGVIAEWQQEQLAPALG